MWAGTRMDGRFPTKIFEAPASYAAPWENQSKWLSVRSVAVKFAADVSLTTTATATATGRTALRRPILSKYLFRLRKSGCQRRVVNSRVKSQGKRILISVKARPCEQNADRDISDRQLPREECRITGSASLQSGDNFDEQSGGSVASRMQTLRAIVPGSRGLDTPIFLKEGVDYIVALKMQVQAMQALADCYSNQNAHAACHASVEGRDREIKGFRAFSTQH